MTFLSMLNNNRFLIVLPLSRIWTFCEMGPFDNIGLPVMGMQVLSEFILTTEDTCDKIDSEQLYKDISVYKDLVKWIQKIPGRLIKIFEFPDRSFFRCGTLFKSTKMPLYGMNESYKLQKAPPLMKGGFSEPLKQL